MNAIVVMAGVTTSSRIGLIGMSTPTTDRTNWREQAACQSADTNAWFNNGPLDTAMTICATCPVKDWCAVEGLNEAYGIFGGWGAKERESVREKLTYKEGSNPSHEQLAVYRQRLVDAGYDHLEGEDMFVVAKREGYNKDHFVRIFADHVPARIYTRLKKRKGVLLDRAAAAKRRKERRLEYLNGA